MISAGWMLVVVQLLQSTPIGVAVNQLHQSANVGVSVTRILSLVSCGTNLIMDTLWHESYCWSSVARILLASQLASQPASQQPKTKLLCLIVHEIIQALIHQSISQ